MNSDSNEIRVVDSVTDSCFFKDLLHDLDMASPKEGVREEGKTLIKNMSTPVLDNRIFESKLGLTNVKVNSPFIDDRTIVT
jgi:hypothetical protein